MLVPLNLGLKLIYAPPKRDYFVVLASWRHFKTSHIIPR